VPHAVQAMLTPPEIVLPGCYIDSVFPINVLGQSVFHKYIVFLNSILSHSFC